MSNIKTYRITASDFDWAEVVLQVNHEVLSVEMANEINGFWGGSGWRTIQAKDNPVLAVIRLFGANAISHFLADGGADFTAKDEEHSERLTKDLLDEFGEGWPGAQQLGILIKSAEVNSVSYDDVDMEECPDV